MKLVARTTGAEATRDLAASVAELTRPGDLLLLAGDLGAGKTTFTQGLARGLGVQGHVTSPTFTLAREYQGRIGLHHLDVYRLEDLAEVLDLDLPELLDDRAVVVIEWGDAIVGAVPADYLEIRIELGDADGADDERRLTFSVTGSSWSARQRALSTALAPWLGEDGS